jgi:hypothetical protein
MTKGIDRRFWFDSVTEVAKAMKFISRYFSGKKFKYSRDQLDEMEANVIASIYQAGINAKNSFLDGTLSKPVDDYWILQPTLDNKVEAYIAFACSNELKSYAKAIGAFRYKTQAELEASIDRDNTQEDSEASADNVSVQLFHEEYSSLESGFDDDGSALFIASSAYRQPEREAIAEDLFVKVNNVVDLVLKSYKDEKQQIYLKDIFWRQHVLLGLTQHQLAEAYDISPDNSNMLLKRFKEKLKDAVIEILGIHVDSDEIVELDGFINSIAGYIDLENMKLSDLNDEDQLDDDATGTDK